mmetsp:Transcript_1629/g.4878  ORF Transcript_1629/g.4878 Transcript_1629/m.4878 type:complete len:269 (+) Transcript_1629:2140-2946(+)
MLPFVVGPPLVAARDVFVFVSARVEGSGDGLKLDVIFCILVKLLLLRLPDGPLRGRLALRRLRVRRSRLLLPQSERPRGRAHRGPPAIGSCSNLFRVGRLEGGPGRLDRVRVLTFNRRVNVRRRAPRRGGRGQSLLRLGFGRRALLHVLDVKSHAFFQVGARRARVGRRALVVDWGPPFVARSLQSRLLRQRALDGRLAAALRPVDGDGVVALDGRPRGHARHGALRVGGGRRLGSRRASANGARGSIAASASSSRLRPAVAGCLDFL